MRIWFFLYVISDNSDKPKIDFLNEIHSTVKVFVKAYRQMSYFSVTTWNSKKHLLPFIKYLHLLSAQRTTIHVDQMNLWSEYPDCYISGYSINFKWPVLFLCVVNIIWCLVCFDSWSLCPGWFFIFIGLVIEHLQMLIVKPSNVQFQHFSAVHTFTKSR